MFPIARILVAILLLSSKSVAHVAAAAEPPDLLAVRTLSMTFPAAGSSNETVKFKITASHIDPSLETELPSLATEDPTVYGASLRIRDSSVTGAMLNITLPAAGWRKIGSPARQFRYKGSLGGGPCSLVTIDSKGWKAKCKGLTFKSPPIAGALRVSLSVGTDPKRYCAELDAAYMRDNDPHRVRGGKTPDAASCYTCGDGTIDGDEMCDVAAAPDGCGVGFGCTSSEEVCSCLPSCDTVTPGDATIANAVDAAMAGLANPWANADDFATFLRRVEVYLGCSLLGSTPRSRTARVGRSLIHEYNPDVRYCGPQDSSTFGWLESVVVGECLNQACFAHDVCYAQNCVDTDPHTCYFTEQSRVTPCDSPLQDACSSCSGSMTYIGRAVCWEIDRLVARHENDPICWSPPCGGLDCNSDTESCRPCKYMAFTTGDPGVPGDNTSVTGIAAYDGWQTAIINAAACPGVPIAPEGLTITIFPEAGTVPVYGVSTLVHAGTSPPTCPANACGTSSGFGGGGTLGGQVSVNGVVGYYINLPGGLYDSTQWCCGLTDCYPMTQIDSFRYCLSTDPNCQFPCSSCDGAAKIDALAICRGQDVTPQ